MVAALIFSGLLLLVGAGIAWIFWYIHPSPTRAARSTQRRREQERREGAAMLAAEAELREKSSQS